jgi:hypothetical protein
MKNRNKVSSGVISAESIAVPKLGGEASVIVGSHLNSRKKEDQSDLIVDKKDAHEEEDRSQASDLSISSDHHWIRENLHVL